MLLCFNNYCAIITYLIGKGGVATPLFEQLSKSIKETTMTTKICNECKMVKETSCFSKHTKTNDSLYGFCKDCQSIKYLNYRRTKDGVFTKIYAHQKESSRKRKMPLPAYTKQELINFCYKNNFEELYNNWVKSEYKKELKPSIDRLDDFKPYTLDNIRLVTWKENESKGHKDRLNAIGTQGQLCKAIIQYDKDFNIVEEFVSLSEARRKKGRTIDNSLYKGIISSQGFYFRYK